MIFLSILYLDPEFNMISAMAASCKSSDNETLGRALVYVLYSNDKCAAAMEYMLSQTILYTAERSVLFRANTMEAKMFKYYAMLAAAPFLWETLARFVWELQRDG